MNLLQRAVNLATAFGVGDVCAWTPALSHIFPDASAVRPHGANRLTIVFGPVLEAGSPGLSAFVWKGLACHKPLTLTASSAALLSHGAPGSPGSADSSPGNMFTAALHPPTLSHQEGDWAGVVGSVGLIQTMNLLNTVLCNHPWCRAGDLLAVAELRSCSLLIKPTWRPGLFITNLYCLLFIRHHFIFLKLFHPTQLPSGSTIATSSHKIYIL